MASHSKVSSEEKLQLDAEATRFSNIALGVGVVGSIAHLSAHNVVDNLFVQGMYVVVALWIALVVARSGDSTHVNASGTNARHIP